MEVDATQPQPRRSAVGSWFIYDIGNTVFWAGIVGLSFPLWVTKAVDDVPPGMGGDDATLGYTLAGAMAVVLVLSPILGAISDQAGRRTPMLLATTLVSIAATLFIGSGGLTTSLALLALALCSMEIGTVFYNALLTEVSSETNRGTIAGLGIGIGYIGALFGVGAALILAEREGYVFVFRVIAILFFLFALPIFLLLKERRREVAASGLSTKVLQGFVQLRDLRGLHRFPGFRPYLVSRFLFSLGINTSTAFGVVFASQTVGLSDQEIYLVILSGIAIAVPSAAAWGRLADRIGAGRVITTGLLIWVGLLLLAVGIPELELSKHLYWIVGCLSGVAIGAVFSADRPYLLELTPPQYVGEFFGLHGMVGKLGRVTGLALWPLISTTLGFGQEAAVISLVVCIGLSFVVLKSLGPPSRNERVLKRESEAPSSRPSPVKEEG